MSLIRYISEEMKKLKENRIMLVSVIVVLLVPLVYAMIMLSPKWGPRDNIDNVPVAIVNHDKGAVNDGEFINVGEQLVENLKANPTLGWDFVSAEEAERGMEKQRYFMMIEVPEDFSKKVITVMDDNPQKAELKYVQNEGLHYMGAQVTDTAIETIKNQLSEEVTKTYVENVFSQLGEVAEGFTEAADGAEQINDGSEQLKDGSDQILTALTEKSSDIGRLADGAKQLEDGTKTLKGSLVSKQGDISKLADGAKQVNDGTGQLLGALNEKAPDIKRLSDGASELKAGAKELQDGSKQLLDGAKTAKAGSKQLKDGLGELAAGSAELAAGVVQAQAGVNETIESMGTLHESIKLLSTLDKDHPMYDGILNTVLDELGKSMAEAPKKKKDFQRLVDGANRLKDNLQKGSEFNNGMTALDNGLGELVAGQEQLNAGAGRLVDGASQIADGNKTVAAGWNELQVNVNKLHDGTSQISDGNRTVESGWRELISGATQLDDGATQISDGNQTVKEGWATLTDGVTQVDDGLFQLVDGSEELYEGLKGGAERTSSINPEEENITMFSSPVVLDGEVIHSFPFYRDANAPYILTLALFVGIFAMSFVVSFRKPAVIPSSGITWFTGKIVKLASLAIAQALIISLFALLVLKVEVHSSLAFILFSIYVSLTFLMILLFLVALAGNVGRFIALIFVVLQLSTTGAPLPIHMLPEGLRNLSVFLPFTYSIDGFKNIITLGSTSNVWADVSVLFIYFALFAILALLVFLVRFRNIDSADHHTDEPTEITG